MQGMISFNLFVKVFVITLYPTLHRLMGWNCEIIFGCFTLEIRTMSVPFAPSGSKLISRKIITNSQRESLTMFQDFL